MRVAMWYDNRDVRLEEVPTPQIGPGELLMRVEASGICGSDGMEWYRVSRAPLVLGHEVAGVVVAVAEGVEHFKKGDRITVAHHVPCNTCHYCLSGHHSVCDTLRSTCFDPGGFSEYVRVPAINVDRGVLLLPDEVSFEEATFTEPLACVLRGQRLARLQPGQSVLVVGSGLAGILHVAVARTLGAGRIVATDIVDHRLRMAQQFGADAVIHAEEDVPACLRKVNDGRLADLVVICTEAEPAIAQALQSVERGGTVLFFAAARPDATLPMTMNELFWRTEITLTSSYAGPPADSAAALELIRTRRVPVRQMITHRLSLAETGLGFHLLTHPQEQASLKIIIEPQR
jgi:L-iditol 2-dehydrogenase